ncbi:MAG TPA: hypothetical protein VFN90_06705 [Gemmatimonadales bacterium]|nr:hypothetical protein [Gemmatimonadales bacterium]
MIAYEIYKVIHLFSMFLLFTILGGIALHALNGGTRETNRGRKLVGALHGIALFLILLGGFGMLARLGIVQGGLPGWIWAKLAIWVALPVIGTMPYRKPATAKAVLLALPVIGALSAYFAIYKPF